MALFFGTVVCAGGCFFAGYEFAHAMQRKAHTHEWSKWRRVGAKWKGDYTVTLNVRECATCGLTEAQPIS